MQAHSSELRCLADELFAQDELIRLRQVVETRPLDIAAVLVFDRSLRGPSIVGLSPNGLGRYEMADRDIFRPLQYCGAYFGLIYAGTAPEWLARQLVQMSSAHLEGLVKRIGNVLNLPLGAALRQKIAKRKIDPVTWDQIDRYARVYNDAKHHFGQAKDTHLFSTQDSLLAYFASRKFGAKLYRLTRLSTDISLFEREPSDVEEHLQQWGNLRALSQQPVEDQQGW